MNTGNRPHRAAALPLLAVRLALGVATCLLLGGAGCARRQSAGPPLPAPVPALRSGWFRDVTLAAGITYQWPAPERTPLTNVETIGSGCAFLDADGDGWLDLLLVGSPRCGLFLNRRDGTFRDATTASGLAEVTGPWRGCAVADLTGDGLPELLLTGLNVLKLLRASPGPRFAEWSTGAPPRPRGWATSAGFMDLDGDRDLDLVVAQYLEIDPLSPRFCEVRPGLFTSCTPDRYAPQFPRLFRNDGARGFTELATETGIHRSGGKGLALAFTDFDRDGRQDLYLANDGVAADLFHNLGVKRGVPHFDNVALPMGVAMGVDGLPQAGMGADWGDFDRDGRLDLAVTAFSDQPYSLYRRRAADFEQVSHQLGIAAPTRLPLGFGVKWLDFDNDGWLDLVFANGHIHDNAEAVDPRLRFRQSLQLFHNRQGKQFKEATVEAGPQFARPIVGRGVAAGDYDRDGRVDLLVVDAFDRPLLLHNEAPPADWLEVELQSPPPNPLAYGARVTVKTTHGELVGEVSPASSYLSSSSPILHFGLRNSPPERLEIDWPDGRRQRVEAPRKNRRLTIRHPSLSNH